jgi:hypothetical protein
LFIGKSSTGEMTHFPLVGAVATGCALLSICLVRFLKTPVAETTAGGNPGFERGVLLLAGERKYAIKET